MKEKGNDVELGLPGIGTPIKAGEETGPAPARDSKSHRTRLGFAAREIW